jgi:hypothetical protein
MSYKMATLPRARLKIEVSMARHVFFSFHFNNDAWRAPQVRNSGVIDGNHPVRDNE